MTTLRNPLVDSSEGYEEDADPHGMAMSSAGFYPQDVSASSADMAAGIFRDSSGNLVLKDANSGQHTLSALASGAGSSGGVTSVNGQTGAVTLGSASSRNVPSGTDAGSTEVVLGADSRLSDDRTANKIRNSDGLVSITGSLPTYGQVLTAGYGNTAQWMNAQTSFFTGSPGGVVYADSLGDANVDATNFHWDETNKRLGLGVSSPSQRLDVLGAAKITNQVTAGTTGETATVIVTGGPSTKGLQIKGSSYSTTPFNPSTDVSGIAAWFKASDLALSDGTLVTSWPSASGSRTLTASGSNCPTLKTSIVNGYSTVRFSGSNKMSVSSWTQSQPVSVFFVAKPTAYSGNGNNYLIDFGGNTMVTSFPSATAVNTYSGSLLQHAVSSMTNNWVFTSTINNGASSLVNAWGATPTSGNAGSNNGNGTVTIGQYSGSMLYGFTGDIAEVIIYTGALSTTDRQKVEAYLAWKYGLQSRLPVSHPYYSVDINGTTQQTANLLEVQSSDGTVLAKISSDGSISTSTLNSSGTLAIDGTTVTIGTTSGMTVKVGISDGKVSFFGGSGALKQTAANLTAYSVNTGTSGQTVNVGTTFNQAIINGNFYQLATKLNALLDALRAYGLIT